MTKKEYFMNNAPCAELPLTYVSSYVLYGIEYGINEFAYIAYKHRGTIKSYHKLMLNVLHGKRLHMSEFYRV